MADKREDKDVQDVQSEVPEEDWPPTSAVQVYEQGPSTASLNPFGGRSVSLADDGNRERILGEIAGGMQLLQEAMGRVLIEGSDYGLIPGTQRPSLWQPGAEKIRAMFGFTAPTSITNAYEDWENRVFAYTAECEVWDQHGRLLTKASATCSTEEDRYREVHTERVKTRRDGSTYTLPARDPADQREVVMMMAQKRAFVAAIRRTAAASGTFTQDEELVPEDRATGGGRGGGGNRGGGRGGPQGGQRSPFRKPGDDTKGECPIHAGWYFNRTPKMKGHGHPNPNRQGTWCNYYQVKQMAEQRANEIFGQLFPERTYGDSERFTTWLEHNFPDINADPDNWSLDEWHRVITGARSELDARTAAEPAVESEEPQQASWGDWGATGQEDAKEGDEPGG